MKFFTPSEAAVTLPLVRKIVEDILSTGQKIRELALSPGQNPGETESFIELRTNLMSYMDELHDLGCYYKDWNFEIGLVDFPAIINGEEVMLCWRSDEPNISYFHSFEDGYRGRKPIPKELLNS